MKYSFMFSLYSLSHALFHTFYVPHTLIHCSTILLLPPLSKLFFAFFLFLFVSLTSFLGKVLWYAMCFNACAVNSTSLCNIIFIFSSLYHSCVSLSISCLLMIRDHNFIVKPIILNIIMCITSWYHLLVSLYMILFLM